MCTTDREAIIGGEDPSFPTDCAHINTFAVGNGGRRWYKKKAGGLHSDCCGQRLAWFTVNLCAGIDGRLGWRVLFAAA